MSEYFVVDEECCTVVDGFDVREDAEKNAVDRGPEFCVADRGALELVEMCSDRSISWELDEDVVTDGGRDVEDLETVREDLARRDGRDDDPDDPPAIACDGGREQCPVCDSTRVHIEGGCPMCANCGWSKCGGARR